MGDSASSSSVIQPAPIASDMSCSSSRGSLLQRLADVELQSVMRILGVRELVSFALCSRRLLRLADRPFIWTHLSRSVTRASRRSRLLAHSAVNPHATGCFCHLSARLCFHWSGACLRPGDHDFLFDCLRNVHVQQIIHLELGSGQCGVATWKAILISPAMQHVRSLTLRRAGWSCLDATMMLIITHQMPQLHTLVLAPDTRYPFFQIHGESKSEAEAVEGDGAASMLQRGFPYHRTPQVRARELELAEATCGDFWSMLADAPALTSLKLVDSGFDQARSRLAHVGRGANIVQLELFAPALYGRGAFGAFFSSHNMRQLQSLSLELFIAGGLKEEEEAAVITPTAADYATSFAALASLSTLHLRCVSGVSALLPALVHARSLQRLFICPGVHLRRLERSMASASCKLPSADALSHLLSTSTKLDCTLQLAPLKQERATPLFLRHFTASIDAGARTRLHVTHSLA